MKKPKLSHLTINKPICRRTAIKERYADGWLSPEGDYWPCEPQGHLDLADYITNNDNYGGEKLLEGRGWTKVSMNQWFNNGRSRLTQAQIDFIFDWCRVNGKSYPPECLQCIIEDMDNGLL